MSDAAELVASIFSVVVTVFIGFLLVKALQGGDISRLASTFAAFMPGFIVALVVIFSVATILKSF